MPYVDPIDPATPASGDAVGSGDDRIRELKRALIERIETVFADIDVNPLGFIAGIIATAALANKAVTYAKIQDVAATDRLLGRSTAGAGVIEEIVCTAFARSILDDANAAAVLSTLGISSVLPTMWAWIRTASPFSIPDAAATEIEWDDEIEDVGGWFDIASPTKLTIPVGGAANKLFLNLGITINPTTSAGDVVLAQIMKNGSDVLAAHSVESAIDPAGSRYLQVFAIDRDLAEGDYYEAVVDQRTGAAIDISGANMGFQVHMIT